MRQTGPVENRLIRVFAYASVISTYILILLGGYVTTSGSGLGCGESWPLCNGGVLPSATDPGTIIEFSHRAFNIVVAFFVVGTLILAWRSYRWNRNVVLFSTASFLGLLGQVILGMFTVSTSLDPLVSAAHLGLASAVFGLIVVNAVMVWSMQSKSLELTR